MIEYKPCEDILPPPSRELVRLIEKQNDADVRALVMKMDDEILSVVVTNESNDIGNWRSPTLDG